MPVADTHVIPEGLVGRRIAAMRANQHEANARNAAPQRRLQAHATTLAAPAAAPPPVPHEVRAQTTSAATAAAAQNIAPQPQEVRASSTSTTGSAETASPQPVPAVTRQPSQQAVASGGGVLTPPTHAEMKQAKRVQKQALQQALATKKDLDANGNRFALRSANVKDGRVPFSRPVTVLAIPSPFGTRREDGSRYKHKLKLFRKSNQEWVDTQKSAHSDANELRNQHEKVLGLNKEAHGLGEMAASERYLASAVSTVGDAAAAGSTLTGGADGFTASIGTMSKIGAALILRRAETHSAQAEKLTDTTITELDANRADHGEIKEALSAIKDGHHAAQKNATRKKRAAVVQAIAQSTGLVGDHVGLSSGSEEALDTTGSALRGQGVEGHAWTFGKPTAYTAAETGLDAAQDGGINAVSNAYRPAKNRVVGGADKSEAKRLQQEAAAREIAAYRSMKGSSRSTHTDNPMRAQTPPARTRT